MYKLIVAIFNRKLSIIWWHMHVCNPLLMIIIMRRLWGCCRFRNSSALQVCRIPNTRCGNNIHYTLRTFRVYLVKHNTCSLQHTHLKLLSVLTIERHRELFPSAIKSINVSHINSYSCLPHHWTETMIPFIYRFGETFAWHDGNTWNNSFMVLLPLLLYFILLAMCWDLAASPSLGVDDATTNWFI